MKASVLLFVAALLFGCGLNQPCHAQNPVTGACVAFAADGAVATGTLSHGDLETKLEDGAVVSTTHLAVAGSPVRGLSQGCELAFSNDGKWLAIVAPGGDQLTVTIFDRKARSVHRKFSSDWYRFHDFDFERMYQSSFLGGFLEDDSLVLWRYVPVAVAAPSDASHADLHLQRWSTEGVVLSDQELGGVGFGVGGRQPVASNDLSLLWIPSRCAEASCYRGVRISQGQIADAGTLTLPGDNAAEPVALLGNELFLSVLGEKTTQKAALLDSSGRVQAEASLPFFPNLLGPLVPDWFKVRPLAVSHDGEIAAVPRTRLAWVLVDTDRDWGSEIVLLKMHPLTVATKFNTGKGGIGPIAVDHRDGTLRLVGFWDGRWHHRQCDEKHPDKCR